MSDYLPPVVIDVLGRDSDLLATLAQAKTALLNFARETPTVVLGADGRPLERTVAAADAELDALGAKVVEPTIRPKVDDSNLALLAGARTTAGASAIATALGLSTLAMTGPASRWAPTVLAGAAGGGGGGMWNALGMGTSGLPFLGGLAGFGTLASLLGFGAEHVAFTGLGIAGSAGAGLLGGGLLGLGSLGVAGVGMGTDMAGIGQAASDIKSVSGVLNQYQTLQQALAKQIPQTAAAQAALNAQLAGFAPVAQGAVLSASLTVQQFHAMFDYLTGPAEKVGAQILQQAVQVGEKFLPTIGKYALTNMGIIQAQLQPFFAWLQNPSPSGGLGIFTDLENEFTKNLPTAMHAFTQFFELLIKTIDAASHYTGGFIRTLDTFFTKWNNNGWAKWASEIGTLIGVFRVWWGFFKQIAITIYDVFRPAVGAGTAIIRGLTGGLKDLDKWLTSSKIQGELHNLFSVHLQELIQGIGGLIKGLLPIAESFMSVFIQWSTRGAGLMVLILKPLDAFVRLVSGNAVTRTLAGWALMLGLVVSRVGPLVAIVGGLTKAWATAGMAALGAGRNFITAGAEGAASARAAGGIAVGTDVGAAFAGTQAGTLAMLRGRIGAVMQGVGAMAGFGALGAIGGGALAGATENTHQHKRLARDLTTAGGGILGAGLGLMQVNPLAGGVVAGVGALTMAAGEIVNHWKGISKFFADDVWHPIRRVALDFWHSFDNDVIHPIERFPGNLMKWFSEGFGAVVRFFSQLPHTILNYLASLPRQLGYLAGFWMGMLVRGVIDGAKLLWAFWSTVGSTILRFLARLPGDLLKLGEDALHAMWTGITGAAKDLWTFFTQLPGKLINFLINLPSQFTSQGHGVIHGFWQGIMDEVKTVWFFFTNLPVVILSFLKDAGRWLYDVGKQIIQGLIHGVKDAAGGIGSAIKSVAGGVISGFKSALGISSPSRVFMELGQHTMMGYIVGVQSMAPRVQAAVIGASYTPRAGGAGGSAGGPGRPGGNVQHFNIYPANNPTDPWRAGAEFAWHVRPHLAGLSH